MTKATTEFDSTFGLVFDRVLTPEEQMFVQQVIGYTSVSALRIPSGEGPSFTWLAEQGVVVSLDTTKTYSDDISFLFGDFWEKLGEYLKNGSKPYERASRGKPAGFQLIPSIGFDAEIVDTITDVDWDEDSRTPGYLSSDEVEYDVLAGVMHVQGQTTDWVEFSNSDTPEAVETVDVTPDRIVVVNVPEGATKITITVEF